MRNLQQVEKDISVFTESCMDGAKDTSIWNVLVTNRERFRGECSSKARQYFRDELQAAEQAEAEVTSAINAATIRTVGGGSIAGINTTFLIAGAVALVALYFLLS